MKIYEFIVKYGYGDNEKVIVGLDELEKALYIQKYDDVAVLGGKQINGNNIIVIEPYRIGLLRTVTVSGEVKEFYSYEYENLDEAFAEVRKSREKIDYLLKTGKKNLIGTNAHLPEFQPVNHQLKLK